MRKTKTNEVCLYDNPDCHPLVMCKGMCSFHYNRTRKGLDPLAPKTQRRSDSAGNKKNCTFSGCIRPLNRYGYCRVHSIEFLAGNELLPLDVWVTCPVDECTGTFNISACRSGMCNRHTKQAHRFHLQKNELMSLLRDAKCSNAECGSTTRLNIDHDHACCPKGKFSNGQYSCGKCIRGMLCHKCNTALGLTNESVDTLRGLIDYLERSPS